MDRATIGLKEIKTYFGYLDCGTLVFKMTGSTAGRCGQNKILIRIIR